MGKLVKDTCQHTGPLPVSPSQLGFGGMGLLPGEWWVLLYHLKGREI